VEISKQQFFISFGATVFCLAGHALWNSGQLNAQQPDQQILQANRVQETPAPEYEEALVDPNDGGKFDQEWVEADLGFGDELLDPSGVAPNGDPLSHHFPAIKSSGTWLWRGHWYTETSLMMMIRKAPTRKIFSRSQMGQRQTQIGQIFGEEPLMTDSDTAHAEAGFRITIGNIIGRDGENRDHAIEASYLGSFEFDSGARLETDPNQQGTLFLEEDFGANILNTIGFSLADVHSFTYNTNLTSAELNLRTRTRLRRDRVLLQPNGKWKRDANAGRLLTTHGGLRYARITEMFNFSSDGMTSGTGRYDVNLHNDMFGLQCGGGLIFQQRNWSCGAKTTAAGMYNFADRDSTIVAVLTDGTDNSRAERLEDDHVVFLGDLNVFAFWQVRPHVGLRVSYDLLYITGIATARNNIGLNQSFPDLHLRGNALFHALSAGFEMVW